MTVSKAAASGNPTSPAPDLLLVCLQDPFAAVGDSSTIAHSLVAAPDSGTAQQWKLEVAMEMHPPRCFESWATYGSFTLDLSVSAAVCPALGVWGGTASTQSGSRNCRVMVLRDADNKVTFSLATAACHATETAMPSPDELRFVNADIAFEINGKTGLSAGAVAVISTRNWARLIAGSTVTTKGLAFDGKWRQNLAAGDGATTVTGAWAFAVMTKDAYLTFCMQHGWLPYILGKE
jgi:hypothetical protein